MGIDPNVVISSIAIIVAIGGIIMTGILTRNSNKLTQQSNELLEIELKSKLRPMFKLIFNLVSPQHNEHLITFDVDIKNYGTVPARKIITKSNKTNNTHLIEITKENDELTTSFPIGTIQNEGSVRFVREIEKTEQIPMCYFIWFEYYYLDKKEETVVLCTINQKNWADVQQKWFIQEDIDEARQEWNNIRTGKRSASI